MMEEYQQAEQERIYAPAMPPMATDRSILAEVTDPVKLIKEMEHKLRGEQFDMNTKAWVSIRPRIANETGIGNFILMVSQIVNQNTILSNLTEKEVDRFILAKCKDIRDHLSLNVPRYEINQTDLKLAHNIITEPIYFCVKRSTNQNEKNWLSKIFHHTDTRTQTNAGRQRGMFSGILRRE